MQTLAVITAIFGEYDELIRPVYFDKLTKEADFFCFTDNTKITSDIFTIIHVSPIFKDPQRNARFYKTVGYHSYTKNYDRILWIDCNIELVLPSFREILEKEQAKDIVVNIHIDRDCLYKEANWAIQAKRDSTQKIRRQIKRIKKTGFPEHYGLSATGFLLRKNIQSVQDFNEEWWTLIKYGSKRDQLSFDYCRWLFRDKLAFGFFYVDWRKNKNGIVHQHAKAYASAHVFSRYEEILQHVARYKNYFSKKLMGIKRLPSALRNRVELALDKDFRKQETERQQLKKMPRFTEADISFLGKTLKIADYPSFQFIKREIFDEGIYRFMTANERPYIIDCGANIGMAVLYFKQLYPAAEIVAFEPDKKIFDILEKNIMQFSFQDVKLINKALWNEETTLRFITEGADAGRAAQQFEKENIVEVGTLKLSPFLNKRTDFVKIDIEGAENNVLQEIQPQLHNVQRLFVEYHSFENSKQHLAEIITILQQSGFRLHISSPGLVSRQPFVKINTYLGMDNQVNIYAIRENVS